MAGGQSSHRRHTFFAPGRFVGWFVEYRDHPGRDSLKRGIKGDVFAVGSK
jgi:hypothetical protein